MAFRPQVPGQGSIHLLRKQALSRGQSVFNTHSGRHPKYGFPWNSDRHVQTPFKHSVLGPQGDKEHSSSTGVDIMAVR